MMVAEGCRRRCEMSAEFSRTGPRRLVATMDVSICVIERLAEVITEHDPGIVDNDVQVRMLRDHLETAARDARRIGNVQLHGAHAGVSGRDRDQRRPVGARQ